MSLSVEQSMLALEVLLAGQPYDYRNDAIIDTIQDRMASLMNSIETLQVTADQEQRALEAEEVERMNAMLEEFKNLEQDLERRREIADASNRMRESQRVSDPNDAVRPNQQENSASSATVNQSAQANRGGNVRVAARPMNQDEINRHGFRSFGEFCGAVRRANSGRDIDRRLFLNAPNEFGREGVGEDGGFLVPPEFRRTIMEKVLAEDSLIGRTDQLTSSSNTITIPVDETTPWQSSGGVQAYWDSEAAQISQSKPQLDQTSIRLHKLTAMVPVTEELLEDGPALAAYINRKAPEKIDFKVTDAIINGTGNGQPLGLLKSASTITVAKESGQVADTVVFDNIVNMWARLYGPARTRAVWLVNSDVEPQLMTMQFPGTGTAVPTYLPPGGLSAAPYGTLLNRPVLPMESCPTLGDAGDIVLTDLSQYMTATKGGGIRSDVSMHLYFDYDMTAYRFIMRVAGQPWWRTAIDKKNGSGKLSSTVILAARD